MTYRVLDHWRLTPYRLAIHEPTATAVIADVHLGYREARQECGEAIPLLDVPTQLAPIRHARQQFSFDKLIVAGDLFERRVQQDLLDEFLNELRTIKVTFVGLVPGNHDRGWEAFQGRLPIFPGGIMLGDWRVVHGDAIEIDDRLVLGHWHPVVHYRGRRAPCYLVGADRLVLPAFSADAAGQSMAREPTWRNLECFAIASGGVRSLRAAATQR